MGLSSRQVSSRGLDWNKTLVEAQNIELPKALPMRKQQQESQSQQQIEAVNCPRCDSTNTKFCYYNNYNKSQPRHFCRSCKRHWTKGGTLRNVPVGGGRKNKRLKKSTSVTTPTNSTNTTPSNAEVGNQKSVPIPSSLYQSIIHQPSMLPSQNLMNTRDSEGKDFGIGNGIFVSSSSMSFPINQTHIFPFSNSTSFDTNTCGVSSSLRSTNVYNNGEEFKTMEESNINSSGTTTQPWEIPTTTSNGMEMSNYWSWEDIDSLVSNDLNAPWDDSDIKP